MRAACVIAVAAAAACSRSGGTYLEIRVPANTKTVELFLGDMPAGSAMIGPPPTGGRYFEGEGWTSMETRASAGTLNGTSLTYRLERDASGSNVLPRLLVVASDIQGEPVGVKIVDDIPVDNRADTLVVTLDPAISIAGASNSQPGVERVQVWRRPGDDGQLSACALVWHPNDAGGSAVEFFVPSDDTDCDGATATECNSSSVWNYCEIDDTKLGISEASCMLSTLDSGACRLGAPPACVDGGCPAPACTPSPVFGCMPAAVCATARANNCSTLDIGCLGKAAAQPNVPRVVCDMDSEQIGAYCGDLLDPSTFAVFDSTRHCASVALASFGPTPMFGSRVMADGLLYSLSGGSMGACGDSLTVTGTPTSPPASTPVFVVIETSPSPNELLYLPLQLNFTGLTQCQPIPRPCVVDSAAIIPCP